MAKLTLPVVLMLCCCLVAADAFSGCHCMGTVRKIIPVRVIKQIKMVPISGHCRRPETILTRRNGSKICIDPDQKWFKDLLREFSGSNVTRNSTTDPGQF